MLKLSTSLCLNLPKSDKQKGGTSNLRRRGTFEQIRAQARMVSAFVTSIVARRQRCQWPPMAANNIFSLPFHIFQESSFSRLLMCFVKKPHQWPPMAANGHQWLPMANGQWPQRAPDRWCLTLASLYPVYTLVRKQPVETTPPI